MNLDEYPCFIDKYLFIAFQERSLRATERILILQPTQDRLTLRMSKIVDHRSNIFDAVYKVEGVCQFELIPNFIYLNQMCPECVLSNVCAMSDKSLHLRYVHLKYKKSKTT